MQLSDGLSLWAKWIQLQDLIGPQSSKLWEREAVGRLDALFSSPRSLTETGEPRLVRDVFRVKTRLWDATGVDSGAEQRLQKPCVELSSPVAKHMVPELTSSCSGRRSMPLAFQSSCADTVCFGDSFKTKSGGGTGS